MNAREAMQALLDGKTIRREDVGVETILRMDDISLVQTYNGFVTRRTVLTGFEVVEEYPLTFEGALRAMLDGKIVEGELHSDLYRFNKVLGFEHLDYDDQWRPCEIEVPEQNAKWKVVE